MCHSSWVINRLLKCAATHKMSVLVANPSWQHQELNQIYTPPRRWGTARSVFNPVCGVCSSSSDRLLQHWGEHWPKASPLQSEFGPQIAPLPHTPILHGTVPRKDAQPGWVPQSAGPPNSPLPALCFSPALMSFSVLTDCHRQMCLVIPALQIFLCSVLCV